MNKEEIESFKELNTDLEDIDDLDMGLEIISYKVRTTMQEFANTIINLQSQLDIANKKLRDGIEFVNNVINATDGCDDCCESEKHILASEMLSIIGGNNE